VKNIDLEMTSKKC